MAAKKSEDSKPPLDTLVSAVANRLEVALGDQQAVHRAVAKVLREDLSSQCDLSHFAVNFLRVDPSTVDSLMSAANGNREAQIDSILSKWVELWGEDATLDAVLKAIYDADETVAVQKIVEAVEALKSGKYARAVQHLSKSHRVARIFWFTDTVLRWGCPAKYNIMEYCKLAILVLVHRGLNLEI